MDYDAIRRTADGIRILGAAIAAGGATAAAVRSQIHEFAATLDRVERERLENRRRPLNDGKDIPRPTAEEAWAIVDLSSLDDDGDTAAMDGAMHSVWLHGDWHFLTQQMATEQKEAAADAVMRHWCRLHDLRGDTEPVSLRWWRE